MKEEQSDTFEKLCEWLDMEAEPHTVSELRTKMIEFAGTDEHAYANNYYLKQQLQKRYGSNIFFSEVNGKSDVVCFSDFTRTIIDDLMLKSQPKENHDLEENQVIEAAAKLLLNQMRLKTLNLTVS